MITHSVLKTSLDRPVIHLGDAALPAESFRLQAECPVRRHTLCDGEQAEEVLGIRKCLFTFSGRCFPDPEEDFRGGLLAAMREGKVFSFEACGCRFTEMRLTDLQWEQKSSSQLLEYTLTLLGNAEGGTA